jgi:hypothetical protein
VVRAGAVARARAVVWAGPHRLRRKTSDSGARIGGAWRGVSVGDRCQSRGDGGSSPLMGIGWWTVPYPGRSVIIPCPRACGSMPRRGGHDLCGCHIAALNASSHCRFRRPLLWLLPPTTATANTTVMLVRLAAQLEEARRDVEQYRLERGIQRATLDAWEERDQRLRAHFEQMDSDHSVLQQQLDATRSSLRDTVDQLNRLEQQQQVRMMMVMMMMMMMMVMMVMMGSSS